MKLKPYPSYKDSGVEWLGDVPEHWVVCRLKHLLSEMVSGGTPDTSNKDNWSDNQDGTPWVAIGDMSEVDVVTETAKSVSTAGLKQKQLRVLPKGTLLFSMYASLGHVAELGIPATTNQAILGLVPNTSANHSYMKRWLQFLQPYLIESASSNTQANLNAEKVRNLPFAIACSVQEQSAIVNFIDCETAKLDTLIAKQEKLIELLQEKRQAIISHAVTKGLNPDAKMKDSGVEWLGGVPEHWDLPKLKFIGAFSGGGTPSRDNPAYWNGNIPWVSPKDMKTKYIIDSEESITTEGLMGSTSNMLVPGHILMVVRSGILKHTIPVAINEVPVAINQDIKAIKLNEDRCFNQFFMYWVQGLNDLLLLTWAKQGATVESIEHAYLANSVIPQPAQKEQIEIVAYLDQETSKINLLIEKAQSSIQLAKEHRVALISAAVTGKIDVREAA